MNNSEIIFLKISILFALQNTYKAPVSFNNLAISTIDFFTTSSLSSFCIGLQKSCSLFDVADDLYITKEPTSSQSKFLDKIFKKHNFDFNNKLFISHQEASEESVINNIGISILSVNYVKRELESGLVTALDFDEEDIQREIQYVYIKNKFLTPAANEFIKLISE